MSDELSLEQRLVLQLSAAMNPEENSSQNGNPGRLPQMPEAALAQTLGVQHNLPQLSQSLPAQQNQFSNAENLNTAELSNLISSIGLIPGLNTGQLNTGQLNADQHLASQLGANQLNAGQLDTSALQSSLQAQGYPMNAMPQPQLPANLQQQLANIPIPQGSLLGQTNNPSLSALNNANLPQSGLQRPQIQPQTQPSTNLPNANAGPSGASQNRGEQISADALISSLLMPNSGGINLSNINLNNINLKEISLDTLTYISNTLGSNAAKQASSIGNSNMDSLASQQSQSQTQPNSQARPHIIPPPQFPQLRRRTSSFIDRERLNNEIQAALDDVRLQELPPAPSVNQPGAGLTATPGTGLSSEQQSSNALPGQATAQTANRNQLRRESFSGIDPDVSTIQSVLQSLLSSNASESQPTAGPSSAPPQPSLNASEPQPSTDLQKSASTGGFDIGSLGLGTEDQSLIDSLRSVFDSSAQAPDSDSSNSLAQSLARLSQQSDSSVADDSARLAPKPKRARLSGPSTRTGSYNDYSSKYKYQSDYTAADPDTLRAIQQALLGALDSSSSTSLTDSSTAVDRASTSSESLRRAMDTPGSQGANAAAAAVAAAAADRASTSAGRRSTSVDGIDEAEVSRINKQRLVENKKKVREDNAARKRRWREVNLLQNRDNDLRARILKRGTELYGPSESPAKSKWIEEEFNRRRQRRILRAGINSIVESARARHAKAQEYGSADGSSDQSISHVRPAGGQQGTLSQQSKQAASSHLSKLFKSSNAALEQHLYTGKLSVPVVPYMLVPFPKRPLYKVPNTEADNDSGNEKSKSQSSPSIEIDSEPQKENNDIENSNNKDEKADDDGSERQDKSESIPRTSNEGDEQQKHVTSEGNGSDEKSQQDSGLPEKNKDVEKGSPLSAVQGDKDSESVEKTGHESAQRRDSGDNANDATAAEHSEERSKDHSPTGRHDNLSNEKQSPATNTEESASDQTFEKSDRYDESSDRPKHRYTLVGNVRLGAPPNLTAIYRKLKGSL